MRLRRAGADGIDWKSDRLTDWATESERRAAYEIQNRFPRGDVDPDHDAETERLREAFYRQWRQETERRLSRVLQPSTFGFLVAGWLVVGAFVASGVRAMGWADGTTVYVTVLLTLALLGVGQYAVQEWIESRRNRAMNALVPRAPQRR